MATKKLTRTAIKKGIGENHQAMVAAVHRVLKKGGVEGLTVHSIRFDAADGFDSPCDPPCDDGFECKPVSHGSGVSFECVKTGG
jgi:hypothetical protein